MRFISELNIEKNRKPLYETILQDKNPIFIWGNGDLAGWVYKYCQHFGIQVIGCFVDQGNGRSWMEDLTILDLKQVIEHYPKFSVIIGHSYYSQGRTKLEEISNVESVYFLSNVYYYVWHMISEDFLKNNAKMLNNIYAQLQDERSRNCLKSYFESRVNDNAVYMFPHFVNGFNYYINDIIQLTEKETLLDIGACTGKAIWPFIEAVQGKYEFIIALEPDADNYSLLVKNIKNRGIERIITKQICAYSDSEYVKFMGEKEFGGVSEDAKDYQLYPAITIDQLCCDLDRQSNITIIKINFPYAVSSILKGAEHLLAERKPKLIIRVGFDEEVLIDVCSTIKKINPEYKFAFRYTVGIPQGLTLFAT